MAFIRDGMSPTGLAGPGATSIMPKGMGENGGGMLTPKPQPVPANNVPMKATPQGVQGAAQAQSQAPMPPLYTPGVNGPVVNSQVPGPTAIIGSPTTPQPGKMQQTGQFPPPPAVPKAAQEALGEAADDEESPDDVLGRLFGFGPQKAAEELTTYNFDTPVRWGKWRMDGLEALEDLERHMTSKALSSGFKPNQKTAAAAPIAGQSLADLLPWNPEVFQQQFQTPQLDVPAPDLSPRSLDAPSPVSRPMVPGGMSPMPSWMANANSDPAIQRAMQQIQSSPATGGTPAVPGGSVSVPAIGPTQQSDARSLSTVAPKTTPTPSSPPESVAASTASPPLAAPSAPAPTPTGGAPVGRYAHLIAELQQKVPQMESRLAGMDPASRSYRFLQNQINTAKFRMKDLDRRQWTSTADVAKGSPQAISRFQRDASNYQAKADAYAANAAAGKAPPLKPIAGGMMPPKAAPAPAAGSVASVTRPAQPPQAPKMAEVLEKIGTYPGCHAGGKKKRMKKKAGDFPDISPLAAAFFIGCCERGLSPDGMRAAIKMACAADERAAEQLQVLLSDDCPLIDKMAEFVKQASPLQSLLSVGDDVLQAGRNFMRSRPRVPTRLPWSSLDELGEAAARTTGNLGHNLAETAEIVPPSLTRPMPSMPRSRWRGTPPPGPQPAAPPSQPPPPPPTVVPAGGGGGRVPPIIRPSPNARPPVGPPPSARGAGAPPAGPPSGPPPVASPAGGAAPVPNGPAGPAGESWWNRYLAQPALGGLGGAGVGNVINMGTDAMFGFQIPGLPYATAAAGSMLRTPMARNQIGRLPPGLARTTLGNLQSVMSGTSDLPETATARNINRAVTAGQFAPTLANIATGQDNWYTPSEGMKTFRGNQMDKALQETFGLTRADIEPLLRIKGIYDKEGILGALKAGWNELTPQQKMGLLVGIGGPVLGLASAAMGHPGLGALLGLGGLGGGGYMMYRGMQDPLAAATHGATPEITQQLHDMIRSDPQFIDDMRTRPRAEQYEGMQKLLNELQQQHAGDEMARAAGQAAA